MAATNGNGSARTAGGDGRLRSWKEIGRWFGVDERTVKRWEAARGMPVHRVPGEARAAVFAYEAELVSWLKSGSAPAGTSAADAPGPVAEPAASPPLARRSPRILAVTVVALVLLLLASGLALRGWQRAAAGHQAVRERVADVRQLARTQVAELSDRLERQPGTVRLRAALASEAAVMLARVASQPDADPALRIDAAEAYRRLAIVQNATDRPSLRDRPAARATLAAALALVAADSSDAGRRVRAQIRIDAARQAAADGAVALAPALLAAATADAAGGPRSLREELALGQSEIAQWQGHYAQAIAAADAVLAGADSGDAGHVLRRLRARDLAAEARFYSGDKAGALAGYRAAAQDAAAAVARWPQEPRFRWALQRQQWNLGSTLTDMGHAAEALPALAASRTGWLAMAKADPEDESVASWVRTIRMSYGEALAGAGQVEAATTELAASLADRRDWLAGRPENAERRRALIVGLNALADVLAPAGRKGEACAHYAEAAAMSRRMAAAGTLTGLDRGAMLRQLRDSTARHCPGGLTPAAKPL